MTKEPRGAQVQGPASAQGAGAWSFSFIGRIALCLALAAFALLTWRLDFLCDDAFITFRYARNFAEGNGLVYHVGIAEPVEGYSEFLWALVLGLGMKLGAAPEVLSRLLSVSAGALLVAVTVRGLDRRFAGSPVATIGAGLALGCAAPLAVWSTGGMATVPAALLALLLFSALHRPGISGEPLNWRRRGVELGVIGASLALVRADGALLVALVLGPGILTVLRARESSLARAAALGAVLSATAFAVHVAWRHSFYGDFLPNTARVKLGFSPAAAGRGFDYVVASMMAMPGLAVLLLGGPIGLALSWRRSGGAAAAGAASVVFGVIAYSIASGGDFMCYSRFLVPAIPFGVLGLGALLEVLDAKARPLAVVLAGATAVTFALPAFDINPVPESARSGFDVRHNQRLSGVKLARSEYAQWQNMSARAREWSVMGRALKKHAPSDASLVYGAVGAIGYYSNLFIYDRNGLVTREVALREPHEQLRSPGHDKTVPAAFFAKYRPTYLQVGLARPQNLEILSRQIGPLEVIGDTEIPGVVLWGQRGR